MTNYKGVSERVHILYEELDVNKSNMAMVCTGDREPPGWVVLVKLERCPDGCVGGEVLYGGDLHACSVCDGAADIPIGIGGAYMGNSYRHDIDGEECWYAELRHIKLVEER